MHTIPLALATSIAAIRATMLLATVHVAASQQPPTADPAVLAGWVAAWSLRKARLFTEDHVHLAAQRLGEHRLLPSPAATA